MGSSLETGSSEQRTEFLITIWKALGGSMEGMESREVSKVDQNWVLEADSGRMKKNWTQGGLGGKQVRDRSTHTSQRLK